MKTIRSITVWSLLVGALWVTAIALHLDARDKQAEGLVSQDTKPITMGIRN